MYPSDPRGKEVFGWVIPSDLLPLNNPYTPTLLHSSPDISFALSWLSMFWKMLKDLKADLPFLLTVLFSHHSCSIEHSFSRKLVGMTLLFILIHTVLLQRNIFLFCCCAFISWALNVTKSSFFFCRFRRQSQGWWLSKVEKAASERYRAAFANRNNEERAYFLAFWHACLQ